MIEENKMDLASLIADSRRPICFIIREAFHLGKLKDISPFVTTGIPSGTYDVRFTLMATAFIETKGWGENIEVIFGDMINDRKPSNTLTVRSYFGRPNGTKGDRIASTIDGRAILKLSEKQTLGLEINRMFANKQATIMYREIQIELRLIED